MQDLAEVVATLGRVQDDLRAMMDQADVYPDDEMAAATITNLVIVLRARVQQWKHDPHDAVRRAIDRRRTHDRRQHNRRGPPSYADDLDLPPIP